MKMETLKVSSLIEPLNLNCYAYEQNSKHIKFTYDYTKSSKSINEESIKVLDLLASNAIRFSVDRDGNILLD